MLPKKNIKIQEIKFPIKETRNNKIKKIKKKYYDE